MRPGHFCPGNRLSARAITLKARCFNEAGAFLPRKPGSPRLVAERSRTLQ